jgi:hypothetical protein
MFREAGTQVSLVKCHPSPSLRGSLMVNFDWLWLPLAGVFPSEQLSAQRTLYIGFRKVKLKKS